MERKQFTFYKSFLDCIENLETNKEKLQAFLLISRYAIYGTPPDLTAVKPCAATVFQIAQPILDTAHERSAKAKKQTNGNTLS